MKRKLLRNFKYLPNSIKLTTHCAMLECIRIPLVSPWSHGAHGYGWPGMAKNNVMKTKWCSNKLEFQNIVKRKKIETQLTALKASCLCWRAYCVIINITIFSPRTPTHTEDTLINVYFSSSFFLALTANVFPPRCSYKKQLLRTTAKLQEPILLFPNKLHLLCVSTSHTVNFAWPQRCGLHEKWMK